MYAGFITHKHSIKRLGVHQRLDMAAFRMAKPYFARGSFPSIKQILHFEGVRGPDGLKVKSPGHADPDHFYDPLRDKGEVPAHIQRHYDLLVQHLTEHDLVRAAFEASWLAHFVVDGLTPAHHTLIKDEVAKVHGHEHATVGLIKYIARGEGALKKNWAVWGGKGIVATHNNFEVGIATSIVGRPLRGNLSQIKLAHARRIGYLDFFKEEAIAIAKLNLYDQFKQKGWSAQMANTIKREVLPQTAQTVAIIWLLAYLDADMQTVQQLATAEVV